MFIQREKEGSKMSFLLSPNLTSLNSVRLQTDNLNTCSKMSTNLGCILLTGESAFIICTALSLTLRMGNQASFTIMRLSDFYIIIHAPLI